jgi:transcriptional regulator with XRE-family HTH domain
MSTLLQAVREERGLSRRDVATRMGLSEQTIYRMEKGKTEVKDIHYFAFAHLYEVPVERLMGDGVAA